MSSKPFMIWVAGVATLLLCNMAVAQNSVVDEAKAYVNKISKPHPPWLGPTTGPLAQPGKSIIYVSADQHNRGARGVGHAVEEAAKVIGWSFRLIDGQGTVAGRSSALQQAANLNPDGIVLGAIEAKEQAALLKQITAMGIKIVGWHSLEKSGKSSELPIFANITTNPIETARAAAMYVISDSNGSAGVVIFTDSADTIATAQKNALIANIHKCAGCKVLGVDNIRVADVPARISQRTAFLLHRFGTKWTYTISINDLYFDHMSSSLVAAMIPGNGYPRSISVGDGSESAFERIRTNHYQIATVSEPLRLHGWQAIDELNRAFSGLKSSGYSTPAHLVTSANIHYDNGRRNEFDPENGYRDIYKKIWGVK